MRRPDWRHMLNEMTLSEYFKWYGYFGERPFSIDLIDYGFSLSTSSAYNIAAGKQVTEVMDFSLIHREKANTEFMTDEQIMAVAESSSGVMRIEPD
ncbi:phage tail assembly protein T [Pasteurellaceae bacterium TAE3-ERU1]|nr:phage tail assembly protein T [Pasteurellaceae bacterium TAE3-ERU1]